MAVAAAAPIALEPNDRIIAFGDVHGAYQELVSLLRTTGIVDGDLTWAAGDALVVSVGDLLDRGPDSRQVLDLLMRLEREAQSAGGNLAVIAGNHEVMNLMDDLRYVTGPEFAAFAADESPELRARMFEEFAALPQNAAAASEALTVEFDQQFPPGWFAYQQAFSAEGIYGEWLLDRPQLLVVGETAFVHGGLPPIVAELGLDALNQRYREQLAGYYAAVGQLEQAGVISRFDDANERTEKVRAWLTTHPDDATPVHAAAESMIAADESATLGQDSPLWYRGTAICHETLEEPTITAALDRLGVERVVMGHTPTPGGRIYERFDGRALRIDTGMNRAVYRGHPAALVILPDTYDAVYVETGIDATIEPLPSYAGAERLGVAEPVVLEALEHASIEDRQPTEPDALSVTVNVQGTRVPAIYRWQDERAIQRELAAYRLDRLLGLGLVPPTVARELDGRSGILQLRPGEIASLAELQAAGNPVRASWCPVAPQYQLLYAFDLLIRNERRTPDSILYDTDSWMVMSTQHGTSFGTSSRPPAHLASTALEPLPGLLERLDALTMEQLEATLGEMLSKRELKALLERGRLLPRDAAQAVTAGARR